MNREILGTSILAIMLSACASSSDVATEAAVETEAEKPEPSHYLVPNPYFADIAAGSSKQAKDRLAILAMRGDYEVDFHFQETVPLKAGYEFRDDKDSGAHETVIVVEESEHHIVLQHILVAGGHVIKHWRQDWTFEAPSRFEFIADQTWQVRAIDAEKNAGAWTQCVFEVSDAPRYCGTGRWNHEYGVSTWTSDRTWRPLPRREYTTRNDYNVINAENRHTITPLGWTHEQDNTKTRREGTETAETLVREFGFNHYRTIEGFDFSPATDYWSDTADYWEKVRAAWTERMAPNHTLELKTTIDGMSIIVGTFEQAGRAGETSDDVQYQEIETLLDEWTESRATSSDDQLASNAQN
ncbi:MAG: DUF6607 family protein [Pseudomonadota bacterium]